ncbi:TIR protein [[Leptolyngbya] sp. PCC 7376]|uniref:TIR domain-containing protein n=1 Tax=[Leptolyngbya] sp. PCC 7376 TaxID=111781 RepID=UPI00029F24B6|nr:TIR domain-containing protein [[Leptolyngbya] sp. PCC 7376]AFY40594.1 TIR protein [[Leptolyngbya] sp. PCC 7376]
MSKNASPSTTTPFKNAFICYGRADSLEFTKWLNDQLVAQGYDIWFDFKNIPQGVDYQKQINAGIENADNFIFVIAPHATNSPYCRKEVELAIALNKRLIPIMHVEEISRETWQGRNPNDTDEQWEAYKAEGLHSCFTNLHPELGKINWNQVSFKEDESDYGQSLQALIDILERQSNYVRQHTEFLHAALVWKKQQKQSQFLLSEEQTLRGQHWLQTKFHHEQSPCQPTDLHGEFITESLKQLPNGMPQIFFIYIPENSDRMALLRQQLWREGYSVWTEEADIQLGKDFDTEVLRGIEGSDSLIYLASAQCIESAEQQAQIQYAQKLNKRIIPVKLEAIAPNNIPNNQQQLAWLDFTGTEAATKQLVISQILKAIKEDAGYYEQHRQILVKALSWDRQKRPKSLLLQGQDFTLAEQWLALSATEQDSRATDLQQIYINTSKAMNQFFDVFISYGRADSKSFATMLHDCLVEQGFNVWFDQNDIPLGVDFQEQIKAGIEKAHNFIFIIAPHSINSPYCNKEIDLALNLNKRIIPIMHVEEISKETWQQRNPYKTEESDWEAAQERGEHSSFNNMNPEIGKINWVYCREQDDFDDSFERLMKLCRQHEDYVKQHTEILAKALSWQSHQQQSQYLLVGEDRIAAEGWLLTRFTDTQAPCFPTDLHCEYVTKSIRNANNLMTQVFLSYADEDNEMEAKIRRSLMREGYTIWSSQRDIEAGVDFAEAIKHGLEATDTIVYLLSPHSLGSEFCQREIAYAQSLNKRIIPLSIAPIDETDLSPTIRAIQYIDLSCLDENEEAYRKGINVLLKLLTQDKIYYEQHKTILVRALKWQAQQKNTSILLRGHNLREADTWLKIAAKRSEYPATALHQEFIQTSLDQPEDVALDVFVSYSRADSDFVRQLNDALQVQEKTTWFDQESIASGSDFQQEIFHGIESCDNFLFVISPNSVNSDYCGGEVEHAAKLNKRIVTVLHRSVNPASLHPELAKIQWIDFHNNDGDFYANFSELIRTLDTDREHVRNHTQWSQRALAWRQKDNEDLLLRGSELAIAQNWLDKASRTKIIPLTTALQREFIEASHALETRIEVEKTKAEIDVLNSLSQTRRIVNDQLGALLVSVKAGKLLSEKMPAEIKHQTAQILGQTIYGMQEYNRLQKPGNKVLNVRFSPDGKTIASVGTDLCVHLWSREGKLLKSLRGHKEWIHGIGFSSDNTMLASGSDDHTIKLWSIDGDLIATLEGHEGKVTNLSFSPDNKTIASASADQTIRLWDCKNYCLKATLTGHTDWVRDVNFSPDGQQIVSTGYDSTIRLWHPDGKLAQILEGHEGWGVSVCFSPDGQMIASVGADQTVKLWNSHGELLKTLDGHGSIVVGVCFSPDSQMLVSSSLDHTIKLWNRDGVLLTTFLGHRDFVWNVHFSPDGQLVASAGFDGDVRLWRTDLIFPKMIEAHVDQIFDFCFCGNDGAIASASADKSIKLWKDDGTLLQTFQGHKDWVWGVSCSPDGQRLASCSYDTTVKLWTIDGQLLHSLEDHTGGVMGLEISPDGQAIASASADGTIKVWNWQGQLIHTLKDHKNWVWDVHFSPDSQKIASASADGTIKVWNRENGKLLLTLEGHSEWVRSVSFSPDSQLIASASDDRTIKIWSAEGNLLKTLQGHTYHIHDVRFSPDSQTIASASADKTVKLWSRDGDLLATLQNHQNIVYGARFSPDGKSLASVSADRTIAIWSQDDMKPQSFAIDELLTYGCQWLRDYLKTNPNINERDRNICDL